MWIKPAIVILLFALLVSLASGFYFLMSDKGEGRRVLHSLGVRVSIAISLLALIAYGLVTGQIGNRAPWDRTLDQQRAAESAAQSENINE